MSTSSRRPRLVAVIATAGVVALTGAAITLAAPAGAVPGFSFDRLQGTDRYATAAAIARQSFPGATVALLANGQSDDPRTSRNEDHFPDALAGSYLAGARSAPTLLTTETRLPAATSAALDDLNVTTVVILGGTAAVSASQEQQLRSQGYTVQRVAGSNRYATAAAIARNPGPANVGSIDGDRTAIVASGVQFPDALVMGPLSYAGKLPLTITDPQRLSPETRSALTDLDIDHVLLPGGTNAVSTNVENEIKALGITVKRFAGAVRAETATQVADYALAELAFSDEHVNLALGLRFPDALTGGPHAGKERAPILLTADVDSLGAITRQWLEDHSDTLEDGHIFGGPAAVSANVERQAEEAAEGDGASPSPSASGTASPTASPSRSASPSPTASPDPRSCTGAGGSPTASPAPTSSPTPTPTSTVSPGASPSPTSDSGTPVTRTTRPELLSVAYVSGPTLRDNGTTATNDDFCQISVRYTFDEPVIGKAPVASRFVLVGFEPTTRFQGQTATVEPGGTSVLVTFGRGNDPNTAPDERQDVGTRQVDALTLAIVEQDAVADNTASGNTIGDQPLGSSRSVAAFPPGITAAPDLVDVTVSAFGTTGSSIRYDFDETVASIVKTTGFHAVGDDNRDVACTVSAPSGSSVTATCPLPAASVARAYVESETVSDEPAPDGADGNLNPLHAEDVSDGTTAAPDLVAAQFRPVEDGDDQVLFTFDEPVFIGDPTRFVVYQQDTDEFRSVRAVRQADPTQVLADFEANDDDGDFNVITPGVTALSNAVGVSVLEGAVIEGGDANLPNQEDELAVENSARNTQLAGRTNGPDLLSVTINADLNTATFTFDETLSRTSTTLNRLYLYKSDGSRLTCRGGATNGDSVTCTEFTAGTTSIAAAPDEAVVGAADDGAVNDSGGTPNPEGAHFTTGGTGSPR